ncbi:putative S phase cyclin A-associated protein in the endoplasmic reticulum [Helianthus debilis subsp. tardiflorus]
MDEKSGDAGDDQGSGWLQVKKKHRSNSKFSLQGWVGGLSKKQNSNVVIHEAPQVTSNVSSSEPISTIKDSSTPDSNNSENTNNVPIDDKKDVNFLDKRVVSHVDDSKTNKDHGVTESDNLDVFPKIKFGNLDDDDARIDIKFGDIENTLIENDPIAIEPKEKKIVSTVKEQNKCQELEEVKEISSEDIKVQIVNEELVTQSDEVCQERTQDLKTENLEASGPENVATCPDSSSLQDEKATSGVQTSSVLNELSGVEIMSDIEGGESKERFRQRLWCFLFENLNRAVDELYLLCELECDIDQMKEAVLVLEEAASDFKELNCRVQEFEKVKKSTDNPPMTMKSEQRRPHALSWEVRRMTTSPHRAEILSSSLEAFKKIQQERAAMNDSSRKTGFIDSYGHSRSGSSVNKHTSRTDRTNSAQEPSTVSRKRILPKENTSRGKKNLDSGKNKETEKTGLKKDSFRSMDQSKKSTSGSDREKEKRNSVNGASYKSMDAWKQKRNWEDILTSPYSSSSRFSHSPGMGRKSMERARILHDKLMSPDKKKKTSLDLKKEAEEKHARAMRIRNELENERLQKLQKSTKKLDRVNEWQAVRSTRLREGMYARHQRSETRHEAYLAQVARRAGDESTKVNEVRFITSLNEENKKLMLLQKYQDSELRRAEKLKDMKSKQKEDMAREEAVLERKKLVEAEKMQRLAETQRKKEEALLRREEERKASSAAREAKAMDQMRRREVLVKAQQEEAELLAQKLAERLRESEQRRKFYLEQIKERASMDFRDQSSPLLRRALKTSSGGEEDPQTGGGVAVEGTVLPNLALQHSLKKRIKKIRQRLMALKYELNEPFMGGESGSIGYRAAVGTARAKIGRWLQELQRHRQARKEGAASIGLVTGDIIKFLDGKDPELHASRQAGLLDFVASALPASHTSKPEASQVTVYFLRLLRAILSLPTNRSYFLAQNLLPPMIPMLAAALENFIKITASSSNTSGGKTLIENSDTISAVLDGSLWTVAAIIGHSSSDERQNQMQDGLIELVIAYQVVHRLRDLFALYDRPQVEGSPFPSSILLSINVLVILTSRYRVSTTIDWESYPLETMTKKETSLSISTGNSESSSKLLQDVPEDRPLDDIRKDENSNMVDSGGEQKNLNKSPHKQPVAYLLSAISETGLVCLPSLLTAVLLQANNRLSSEQGSYVLPSNFEEVATGVLKVLNNLALIDINFIQMMLARPDLKMEFFHLMSYLLSHCTSKWGAATDQTGLLLLESLLLLGYFAMFHPENQAVLRWGKSPTILHKVCDLPFVFFSDPELMPVLAGTLVAACFGSEQNKGVVQQELSIEMLVSLLGSCKSGLPKSQPIDELTESTQLGLDSRKLHGDATSQRSNRRKLGKSGAVGNNNRSVKIKNQKDGGKSTRVCEPSSESCSNFMLYSRFPASFIDRAELFFSTESQVYM